MEKKGRRNNSIRDDLSIVKAAAWAWYLHGSGSENKPMPEFDATRMRLQRVPSPSRYKLEAIQQYPSSSTTYTDHDCVHRRNQSLLDAYEIERISKQLDNLIISSSNKFNGLDDKNNSKDTVESSKLWKNNKKKSNFLKGIWFGHTIVCGAREDVDSRALVRNRQLSTAASGCVRHDG